MLFKISDQKPREEENTNVKSRVGNDERKCLRSSKWMNAFLIALLLITFGSIVISTLFWAHLLTVGDVEEGKCVHKNQKGVCLTNSYCCEGEYIIRKDLCSTNGFCCLGSIDKCREPVLNETEMWSFPSLMEISSQIVARNVSEMIIEQSIVISLSAIEDHDLYKDMSERIGQEMSSVTGHKWFGIIGNKQSFDIFLPQFDAYISLTVNDLELLLIRIAFSDRKSQSDDKIEVNFGVDTKPKIEIMRSDMNDSMIEIIKQTIDYILNSCLNNYNCASATTASELNEQFGNEWHCIISANMEDIFLEVDYTEGSFLEINYNNKIKIIVYRTAAIKKLTEYDVIQSGREAIETNNTEIIDSNVDISGIAYALQYIYESIQSNYSYWKLCQHLTAVYNKTHRNDWGCVAGSYGQFSRSISYSQNSYVELKLNLLNVILFEKN